MTDDKVTGRVRRCMQTRREGPRNKKADKTLPTLCKKDSNTGTGRRTRRKEKLKKDYLRVSRIPEEGEMEKVNSKREIASE